MSVVCVHRGSRGLPIIAGGTQYVGTLSFPGATVIELDPTVFTQRGIYVLYDYDTFSGGQAELDANVTVDDSDLLNLTATALTDDTANSRVTVTLS